MTLASILPDGWNKDYDEVEREMKSGEHLCFHFTLWIILLRLVMFWSVALKLSIQIPCIHVSKYVKVRGLDVTERSSAFCRARAALMRLGPVHARRSRSKRARRRHNGGPGCPCQLNGDEDGELPFGPLEDSGSSDPSPHDDRLSKTPTH